MLSNPLVVALLGLVSVIVGGFMLIHPIGPALFIIATTPFDGIMWNLFGFVGNLVIIVPVLAFLVRPPKDGLIEAMLGTPVQRAAAIMILALVVSYIKSANAIGYLVFPLYAQRVALLVIVGMVAVSMPTGKRMLQVVRLLVLSMVAFSILSIAEFYFGLAIIPSVGGTEWGSAGLIGAEIEDHTRGGAFRLRGAGESIPINRFALHLLLPTFLAFGWAVARMHTRDRWLGAICFVVLFVSLMATFSRSGMLGFLAGAPIIALLHFRLRAMNVAAIGALLVALTGAGIALASWAGVGDVLAERWSVEDAGGMASYRLSRWAHGLKLFADSPIIGVGYGRYSTASVPLPSGALDPHNAYIRLLAWQGILGIAAFMYMLFATLRGFFRPYRHVPPEQMFWRPFFLAGFISILVSNLANSYLFDRYLFVALTFAVVAERAELRGLRQASRTAMATVDPVSSSPPDLPHEAEPA